MVQLNEFDATEHESLKFELVPPGEYKMIATESLEKTTKAGTGTYLMFTFEIIEEGAFKGRKIWHIFNWTNPSEEAVRIGKSQFADLCKAVKILQPRSTEELHNSPFIAKIGIKKGTEGREDSNAILKFGASGSSTEKEKRAAAPTSNGKGSSKKVAWE